MYSFYIYVILIYIDIYCIGNAQVRLEKYIFTQSIQSISFEMEKTVHISSKVSFKEKQKVVKRFKNGRRDLIMQYSCNSSILLVILIPF
jgi:hypothetical protein